MRIDHPDHRGVMCVIATVSYGIYNAFLRPASGGGGAALGVLEHFLAVGGSLAIGWLATYLIFRNKPATPPTLAPDSPPSP